MRGVSASAGGMNRAVGDSMGMLGTVMNGLAMQDALDKQGLNSVVMSAIRMEPICEFLTAAGRFALLSSGAWSFSPPGRAIRSLRRTAPPHSRHRNGMQRDYEGDESRWHLYRGSGQGPTATRFDDITYQEVIRRGLQVMDTAAVALCMEQKMPILVFKMQKGNLTTATVEGNLGTLVHC